MFERFRVVVPPIQVSYGVALADNFVLSGFVAYANTRYDYEDYLYSRYPVWSGGNVHYRWTTNDILFGVEGRYYFGEVLNLSGRFNPYAKVMVGYHSIALKKEAIKAYSDIDPILRPLPMGGTFAGIAIGATYNVSDKIAVFGELGYAISLLQLGLVIKM